MPFTYATYISIRAIHGSIHNILFGMTFQSLFMTARGNIVTAIIAGRSILDELDRTGAPRHTRKRRSQFDIFFVSSSNLMYM